MIYTGPTRPTLIRDGKPSLHIVLEVYQLNTCIGYVAHNIFCCKPVLLQNQIVNLQYPENMST